MNERKPLTLEELRKMYNCADRIGVHILLCIDGVFWVEGVIDHRDDDGICAVYSASGKWMKEKDYGKTWAAYATEPPRLDRSAWGPCEVCEELKDPCLEDGCFKKMEMGKACGYNCTRFVKYQKNIKRLHEAKFCPECGRPLTDAAWEMLKRRICNEV